jgi:hypothetical protein
MFLKRVPIYVTRDTNIGMFQYREMMFANISRIPILEINSNILTDPHLLRRIVGTPALIKNDMNTRLQNESS